MVVAAVESARSRLEQDGCLKRSAIVPASIRSSVTDELIRAGFEVSRTTIRKPLLGQLETLLRQGSFVPLKSAPTFVVGATATEVRTAIGALIDAGKARIVLRTRAETLVGIEVDVISDDELKAMKERLSSLTGTVQRVSRRGRGRARLGILRSDLLEALADLPRRLARLPTDREQAQPQSDPESPRNAPIQPGLEATEALLCALDSASDERLGMAFVPKIVRALADRFSSTEAQNLLLRAARSGLIELRPESGLGRLSDAELAACPEGPQGTRLSWARRL